MTNYDIVVLGGGPGGYVSDIRSAQLGNKTAIIYDSPITGTKYKLSYKDLKEKVSVLVLRF